MFAGWNEVAVATCTKIDETTEKEKTDDKFKIHTDGKHYFLVPEKISGEQANRLVTELLKQTKWTAFVSLDDIYKTAYGAYDGVDILYYKNSFVAQDQQAWLAKNGQPAHFTAPAGGFSAALMIHGEMYGIPALKIVNVTHEHYYSSENMV